MNPVIWKQQKKQLKKQELIVVKLVFVVVVYLQANMLRNLT